MFDEIGKSILHDVLGECLSGLVDRGRSLKARRFKAAGWMCVFASIASCVAVVRWPHAISPGVSVVAALLTAVAALGFGFAATFVNTLVVNVRPEVDPICGSHEVEINGSLPNAAKLESHGK
jgi:hypothetical protein